MSLNKIKAADPSRPLLAELWDKSDTGTQAWLQELQAALQKNKLEVAVSVQGGGSPSGGGVTQRMGNRYVITLNPVDDKLEADNKLAVPAEAVILATAKHKKQEYLITPMLIAMLADELYTVYQAVVSRQITYERVTEGKFSVAAYDVLDEMQTKIAAVMALYNQQKSIDYIDHMMALYSSASYPIMRVLFGMLNARLRQKQAANDSTPVTIAELEADFLLWPGASRALLAMAQAGYKHDLTINYSDNSSSFSSKPGGSDYMKRKMEHKAKLMPPGQQAAEFEQLVKEARSNLRQQGVFYRYDP